MQAVTTIGLDIAKSVFQVHGVDAEGNVIIRRKLKRRYIVAFFQKLYSARRSASPTASKSGNREHGHGGRDRSGPRARERQRRRLRARHPIGATGARIIVCCTRCNATGSSGELRASASTGAKRPSSDESSRQKPPRKQSLLVADFINTIDPKETFGKPTQITSSTRRAATSRTVRPSSPAISQREVKRGDVPPQDKKHPGCASA